MYKRYILFTLVIGLTACSDFFSNESPGAMSGEAIFNNAASTEEAICGIYHEFGMDKGYTNRLCCGFAGLNTDCEWSSWSTRTDDQGKCVNYDMAMGNGSLSSVHGDSWQHLSTMIERSNNAIEGIQQYGDTSLGNPLRYYLGEALFLRSFAYLEMVKLWGDVPARFESLSSDPESVNARKQDRNVIYAQLRKDLRHAAELMPWSNEEGMPSQCRNNVGRPSKAAALALLARADLMYAGKAVRPGTLADRQSYSVRYNFEDDQLRKEVFEEVLWACAQVIKKEDYKLADDFETPFKQICQDMQDYDKMEHIWVIPFANGSRGQVLNYNAPKLGSTEVTTCVGHLPGLGSGAKSNGHVCITPYLMYQFEAGDKRVKTTFVCGTWAYDDGSKNFKKYDLTKVFPGSDSLKLYQKPVTLNNYYLGKYRFEWMKRTVSGDDGIDFPVLRYADLLLMFAEAAIGSNTGVIPTNNTGLDGLAQLNKIRKRAGISELSSYDFNAIMTERGKELCGEYIRKYDLERWGILKEQVKKASDFAHSIAVNVGGAETFLNGKAVNLSDTIWFKYSKQSYGGYTIDKVYGLASDETKRPAEFSLQDGWVAQAIYGKDRQWILSDNPNQNTKTLYTVYATEEQLESRQYWPIWQNYLSASNGGLWNNYGY